MLVMVLFVITLIIYRVEELKCCCQQNVPLSSKPSLFPSLLTYSIIYVSAVSDLQIKVYIFTEFAAACTLDN